MQHRAPIQLSRRNFVPQSHNCGASRTYSGALRLEGMLRVVYAWQNELAMTMNANSVQNMVRIPVPVAQGWSVDDYRRSIDLMMQVWERWMPWIAPPALIGLGSVCRRHLTDPKHGLFAILEGLEGHLPRGARLHLFGVKGQALERVKMYEWVAGVDSMAFDFSARVAARKSGHSNTIAHRAIQMDRWMASATRRAVPATRFDDLCRSSMVRWSWAISPVRLSR